MRHADRACRRRRRRAGPAEQRRASPRRPSAPSPRWRNGIHAARPTSTTPAASASTPVTSLAVVPSWRTWCAWRPPLTAARTPNVNAVAARTPGRSDRTTIAAASRRPRSPSERVPGERDPGAGQQQRVVERVGEARRARRRRTRGVVPPACPGRAAPAIEPPGILPGLSRATESGCRTCRRRGSASARHRARRVAVTQVRLADALAVDVHAVHAAVVEQDGLALAAGDDGMAPETEQSSGATSAPIRRPRRSAPRRPRSRRPRPRP